MPMARLRSVESGQGRRRWREEDARRILDLLGASGMTVRAFASREGIDPQRVYAWRRRLGGPEAPAAPAFVELSSRRAAPIEVVLRSGHVVRVAEPFDADALRRLLAVLES
jgi:transposase-like protein